MKQVTEQKTCRMCKSGGLKLVFSLGSSPLANNFLTKKELGEPEVFYPLDVKFCTKCSLLQLGHVVAPDLLFRKYLYVSSTSSVFISHFEAYAQEVYKKYNLNKKSLVVDIGSNDGILLKPFKSLGAKVLGIDPAIKIAQKATEEGLETLPDYFIPKVSEGIVKKYGNADIICANNVFAHTNDLDELVKAVKILLKPDGVFIIEAPYLINFLDQNLFDTVYHEHLSYLSLTPLVAFFQKHNMTVFDVQQTESHGGSFRIFVKGKKAKWKLSNSVKEMLINEKHRGLQSVDTYLEFANKIKNNKNELVRILNRLKSKGKKIAGYGAPAKGNTLLNFFGIGQDVLDYIVDDSPMKQGLFTPGTHIPVVSSEELTNNPPDYLLILAWNFAEPIMKRLTNFSLGGGKFIIPVPVPNIIKKEVNIADNIIEEDLDYIIENIKGEALKLSGKTVLISGGSGFLGSYFTKIFERLNKNILPKPCRIISLDNYITGTPNKNFLGPIEDPNIDFIYHDVRLPLFIEDDIHFIIHAAGLASPFYYQKYPLETIEAAVTGAKNLLEIARSKKIESFLFFSSSEIYGDPDPKFVPTSEDYVGRVSSVGPRACYDESKRLTETICTIYYQKYGVPTKIVRPFNVYGPGMKPDDYRVIPTFLSRGLSGNDLPVHGNGTQTRTFCYISDALIGFMKVLLSGKPGGIYNIGNEKPEITMLQLAEIITKYLNNGTKAITIDYPTSYPAGEPMRRCPDLTKARTELGYNPTINLDGNMDSGMKRTIAWFRSKHNL